MCLEIRKLLGLHFTFTLQISNFISNLCFIYFAENNSSDYGKPMRMSYSAISDPCLSSECMEQIDKVCLLVHLKNYDLHVSYTFTYLCIFYKGFYYFECFVSQED